MIREAIDALVTHRRDLTEDESAAAMADIMDGEATPAQIGAFLTALRLKGETVDEITGMARVMRDRALRVDVEGTLLDVVGTGGDASGTFNVSTATAFVAAGAGLRVAKHGNRAMSSNAGAADTLEALGANITLTPEGVATCIHEAGIGFMFAQAFHPAMRHAAAPRRELGVRTVFNILGPLTNPAFAEHMLLGVATADLGEKMAIALGRLGVTRALVVHGDDGLDELSISAPSTIHDLDGGKVTVSHITPEQFGFTPMPRAAVRGGTPQENAQMMRTVLSGADIPLRDFVLLNVGAALVAGGLAADIAAGIVTGAKVIDSGAALEALDRFVKVSNQVR